MEKFTQIKKINETSVMPDPELMVGKGNDGKEAYALKTEDPVKPITPEEAKNWLPNMSLGAINTNEAPNQELKGPEITPEVTKSEPCKFVSKIFESRQMAHVYHLKATGEGAFAKHKTLDTYYNEILELNDKIIEVYQGQYDILEDYETIDTSKVYNDSNYSDPCMQYFTELAEFIKSTRKMAFLEEDTHLQNIIDEMVALIYRTIYKLKNLK